MKQRKIVITINKKGINVKSFGTVSAAEIIMGALMLLRNTDKDSLGMAISLLQEGEGK